MDQKEKLPTGMTEIRREINAFVPHDCEHGPQDLTCCNQPVLKAAQLPNPQTHCYDSPVVHLRLGSETVSPEGMKPQAPEEDQGPGEGHWPRSSNQDRLCRSPKGPILGYLHADEAWASASVRTLLSVRGTNTIVPRPVSCPSHVTALAFQAASQRRLRTTGRTIPST